MKKTKAQHPQKRGKKYALKKARQVEKTAEEIRELALRKDESRCASERRCHAPDPLEEAADDLYFLFCDERNYPLFCYLDRATIKFFLADCCLTASSRSSIRKLDADGWTL